MQDTSESIETAEPEENGHVPNSDDAAASTVLAEVLPGIAVVFGEVPAELKLDLIDFGLVSTADRKHISAVLASIGNTATVAGTLGTAFAGAQGLYRVSEATTSLLKAGGTLAVKDGADLGAIFARGRIIGQARFIPVAAVSTAQTAAALGGSLSAIALQMQLSEITGLARTNIALTSQVLVTVRREQWAELTALVATIDRAIARAREVESVPASLWDSIAGSEAVLRKQRDLYRLNVDDHVRQIQRLDRRARREHLETNAEAILFDAHALLSSVKAWTGYQALHAARARAAGPEDAGEARLVDAIVRDTGKELQSALKETTTLVGLLMRELRIIAELPGRDTLALPGMRRDSNAARQTSTRLLQALEPLADALHPPVPSLEMPDVVCAPKSLDYEPCLRILRWFLEDGETLRVLGFPDQLDGSDSISSIVSGAKGILGAGKDKTASKDLVAVTDRRIISARASAFLEQGEIRPDIPIDRVRYVRTTAPQEKGGRFVIDLITRDENIRWLFQTDVDDSPLNALAAMLAESMTIPDLERDELLQRRPTSIETAGDDEQTGKSLSEPTAPRS